MLLVSFALSPLSGAGQTPVVDSLRLLLRTHPRRDTTRVRRLQALAQELKTVNAVQATETSQQALKLAQELQDPTGQGEALLGLSNLYRRQTDYVAARRCAHQAQQLYARRQEAKGQGRAWLQLSTIDMVQANLAPALAAALQGLPLAERAGDQQTTTRLQYILGNVYQQMGNYAEALPLLRSALKTGQQTGDHQLILSCLGDLGRAYQMLKKWPQSLLYYQRALSLSQQVGDQQGEAGFETSLAEVHGLRGAQAQAMAHGLRARQLVRANQDTYTLPAVELTLARAYLLAHQTDSALALAHHGLALSQQTRSNDNIRTASDILAQAYAQRGEFDNAYRYRTLHVAYNDTLSGEDTRRNASTLRYGYELAKQKAQNFILTQARQLERQKRHALLAGLGGLVALAALLGRNIVLKQRANRHLNEKNHQVEAHRDALDRALTELQTTQQQLVQSEKFVALAALAAGVAHEIQNPLNFVNNFADVSLELAKELEEAQRGPARDAALEAGLLTDITQNLGKIHQHGTRADRIVKSMLAHARTTTGEHQAVDVNALAAEYLRLAYHAAQAQHRGFEVTRTLELDPHAGELCAVPQELGRVLLNVYANAFYALWARAQAVGPGFTPEVRLRTRRLGQQVELRVYDNGGGIPGAVVNKIFEPFFTTKPTGEGTGLGLSLSHDIIARGYGGSLTVQTKEGECTEFTIGLPIKPPPLNPRA